LPAAKAYRDELIASHPPLGKPIYCAIFKKTNRFGISGLSRIDRWEFSKRRRVRRLYWEAQWPIANFQSRHKKFSILKYGEDGAYRCTIKAREAGLKSISSQTFSPFASRDAATNEAA
jgi:hypothetical protein